MSGLRVLIADDHPVYRDGLRAALAGSADIELVGEAATGAEAVALAAQHHPDVVLMDLRMPGLGGADATAAIVAGGDAKVLVLTMAQDHDAVFSALRAGAHGYLLKGADQAEIIAAVQAVAHGEAVFGRGIAGPVLDHLTANPSEPFPGLPKRELEVLRLLADGMTNQEIASRLYLSRKTVGNHVSNVLTKLNVTSRAAARRLARQEGLQPPEPVKYP